MSGYGVRWRTDDVPDGRLVARFSLGPADAVAALEHVRRVFVAVAVKGHYDGDCEWAGRHDCYESFLRVVDLDTGAEIVSIADAGGDGVELLAVDGALHAVVTNGSEAIRCFNLETGEGHVVAMPFPPGPVLGLAVRWRSGRPVVFCDIGNGGVRAWDLAGGDFEQFDTPLRGWPSALCDLDGELVLAKECADETVTVLRLGDGAVLHQVIVGAGARALVLAGSVLAVAKAGQIELHDLATGETLAPITGDAGYSGLSAFGDRLLTTHAQGEIRLWDLKRTPPPVRPRHAEPIAAGTFVGELLVTADRRGPLLRWRIDDGRAYGPPLRDRPGRISVMASVGPVLLSAGGIDGSPTGTDDSAVRRWDPVSGLPAAPPIDVGHRGVSQCLAVTEWEGRPVILTAGNDGYLSMWDPATGERLRHQVTGRYLARSLVVAQIQGRPVIVITRTIFEPVRFLDLGTWDEADQQVEDWRWDHVWGVVQVSGRPTMVTTDGDHTLRLWTLESRTWLPRTIDHPAPVTAVAVSDTPRPTIAVAHGDCTVALLDPTTGQRTNEPLHLPEPAHVLALGPRAELAACYGTDIALFTTG